jgi:Ca2+-binding RTX toxin-like protein
LYFYTKKEEKLMSNFVGSTTGVPRTGLVYVDGLLWGSRWRIERDSRRLTYSFVNNLNWDDYFDNAQTRACHNAMQSWANVANFRLEFSGYNDYNAEITFHSVTGSTLGRDDILGMAMPPGVNESLFSQGDVMINWEAYQPNSDAALRVGGYYYITFVHELGHALGLAHPHDDGGASSIFPGVSNDQDPGTYGLNQYVWTVMSYYDINSPYSPGEYINWGYIGGPMAFDIAAIQHLYGVNTTHNTGNNTYFLPTTNGVGTYWSCIWDAGGIDTISGQGATNSVTINLNNASLANNDPHAGGYINRMSGIKGGFTIANSRRGRCVIENAVGGNYNDVLTGNAYRNYLSGNYGNDRLNGGGGNDTLYGGFGADYLHGSNGNDYIDSGTPTTYDSANETLNGGAGNDNLLAGSGRDLLIGGTGNDTLLGISGNDLLVGSFGNDKLIGGAGDDRLIGYAGGREYDTLTGGTGSDTFVLGNASGAFYRGLEYATITDFNWTEDWIEAKGIASQYFMRFGAWIGGASRDTAIYYGNDLLSVVEDTTNVSFARDFIFI